MGPIRWTRTVGSNKWSAPQSMHLRIKVWPSHRANCWRGHPKGSPNNFVQSRKVLPNFIHTSQGHQDWCAQCKRERKWYAKIAENITQSWLYLGHLWPVDDGSRKVRIGQRISNLLNLYCQDFFGFKYGCFCPNWSRFCRIISQRIKRLRIQKSFGFVQSDRWIVER